MSEKFYVPVEAIEKQIKLLQELQDEFGFNPVIGYAIDMIRIVNSYDNRVSSYKIGQDYIDGCYIEDAKYSVAWMTDDGVDEVPDDIEWDYEELAVEYSRRLENYAVELWQDVVKDYAYEHAKENE